MTKLLSAVVGIAVVTVIVSLPTVAAAQFATPVSPGYIPDTEVEAALAEGDILFQDPGLTIAVERISASSTAVLDETTNIFHSRFQIHH